MDESPIPVLTADKPGATHKGYMWVFNAPVSGLACFRYDKSRAGEVVDNFLGDYSDTLQTDAYAGYDRYKHRQEVTELLSWLSEDKLTEQLEKDFGLGWGNRFEKQALRFIPVVKAAGGTEAEALDHLLSTRVMRKGKVTSRYDVSLDSLKILKNSVEEFWIEAGLDDEPRKCNELLDADIRRLEGIN